MSRRVTILALGVAVGLAYGLYEVERAVHDMERQISALDRSLAQERQAIRVLRAEWSYLNRPDRLQALAARHLQLTPLTPAQYQPAARIFDVGEPALQQELTGKQAGAAIGGQTQVADTPVPLPALKPIVQGARIVLVRKGARDAD